MGLCKAYVLHLLLQQRLKQLKCLFLSKSYEAFAKLLLVMAIMLSYNS